MSEGGMGRKMAEGREVSQENTFRDKMEATVIWGAVMGSLRHA